MHNKPRITRRRITVALAILVVMGIAGAFALRAVESWGDSWFEAADYPALVEQGAWGRYGLPDTLPPAATDVVIFSPAHGFNLMPVRDEYVEVRFMLPPTQAAALLNAAKLHAPDPTTLSKYSSMLDGLETADDRDRFTPLPKAFQHTLLRPPSEMDIGGISINPETGEVIYWIFEF